MLKSLHGVSLVELLVALLLLELAGAAALTTALTTHRLNRTIATGTVTDIHRWTAVRAAEADSGCRNTSTPRAVSFPLAATASRPALAITLRCGR